MLNVGVLHSGRAPGLDTFRDYANVVCEISRRAPRRAERPRFDAETARIFREEGADVIVCLGYLFLITEPLLDAYEGRIISIHDADLTLRDASGGPRYPGLHATLDAINAGEPETRSTAHIVTAQLDAGPILVRSKPFPVAPFVHEAVARGAQDIVRAYAYAQREWMMRSVWGRLAATALRSLAVEAVA
jgi:folate-dependent phosphoribosylglycinamide formyltransferase PurN